MPSPLATFLGGASWYFQLHLGFTRLEDLRDAGCMKAACIKRASLVVAHFVSARMPAKVSCVAQLPTARSFATWFTAFASSRPQVFPSPLLAAKSPVFVNFPIWGPGNVTFNWNTSFNTFLGVPPTAPSFAGPTFNFA
jgi:hypothetical protein